MLHPPDIIGQQYLTCGYHNQLALKPQKCLRLNVLASNKNLVI